MNKIIPDLFSKNPEDDPIVKYCLEKLRGYKRVMIPSNYWNYTEAKDFFKRICFYEVWEEILADHLWEHHHIDLMQTRKLIEGE